MRLANSPVPGCRTFGRDGFICWFGGRASVRQKRISIISPRSGRWRRKQHRRCYSPQRNRSAYRAAGDHPGARRRTTRPSTDAAGWGPAKPDRSWCGWRRRAAALYACEPGLNVRARRFDQRLLADTPQPGAVQDWRAKNASRRDQRHDSESEALNVFERTGGFFILRFQQLEAARRPSLRSVLKACSWAA